VFRVLAVVPLLLVGRPQFGQLGDRLAIIGAGADVSGANNQYGTIYQPKALTTAGTATTQVLSQQNRNAATKSGQCAKEAGDQGADSDQKTELKNVHCF